MPAAAVGIVAALSCACEQERVVAVRGGLQNMPGATGGVRPAEAEGGEVTPWEGLLARFRPDREGYVPDESRPFRYVNPSDPEDVVLALDTPFHLVTHLQETLAFREYQLLFDQVVSQQLKDNYRERLRDPRETVLFLGQNAEEILALLSSMPYADQTPGQRLQVIGPNAYRLTAPGGGALDLRYNRLDMIIEEGQFRLLRVW